MGNNVASNTENTSGLNCQDKSKKSKTSKSQSMSRNATTFRVSKKNPEIINETQLEISPLEINEHFATQLDQFTKNNCTEVLQGTHFSQNTHVSRVNGFVNTVIACYNFHHNLVIRPDDIWTAIMTQFSFYLNANAEKYRKQFVAHEGQKKLEVFIPGTLHSAPYDLFVTKMSEKIDENLVDKQVKDWILPNFTTTTKDDLVTCGVIFMASMKKYYHYYCGLLCGIPWITLEGTLKDWKDILSRLEKLKSYDLQEWYDMLEPIVKQFVQAKKGNIDLHFWNRICHYEEFGSGPNYIGGWLSAFCVFTEEGIWQGTLKESPINIKQALAFEERGRKDTANTLPESKWPLIDDNKIPCSVAEVEVIIVDQDGVEHKSVMIAGHMAYEILEDERTLQPKTGWVIALKGESGTKNS